MFEQVNQLSRRQPHPSFTGNLRQDAKVRAQYVANAESLRRETFACMGRAVTQAVAQLWHDMTTPATRSRYA